MLQIERVSRRGLCIFSRRRDFKRIVSFLDEGLPEFTSREFCPPLPDSQQALPSSDLESGQHSCHLINGELSFFMDIFSIQSDKLDETFHRNIALTENRASIIDAIGSCKLNVCFRFGLPFPWLDDQRRMRLVRDVGSCFLGEPNVLFLYFLI